MSDIRISGISVNRRTECDIRVRPDDPTKVIAAAIDLDPPGREYSQAMFYSHDGGVTWHQSRPAELALLGESLPRLGVLGVGYDRYQSDPQVDWTSDGVAWSLTLTRQDRQGTKAIRCYRSVDDGMTWTFEATIVAGAPFLPHQPDRDLLWVDHSPTSPFRDQMYALWHDGSSVNFARRTAGEDGSWQAPIPLSGSETTRYDANGDVKTNSDGDIVVFWVDAEGSRKIWMVKSTKGGVEFSTPLEVARTATDSHILIIPAAQRRGARMYPSADAYRTPAKDLVYFVWTDFDGGANTRVWFRRSLDGVWGPPHMLDDQPPLHDQFNSRLCVDQSNGNIVVTYRDTIGDPSRRRCNVFMRVSTDDGQTWSIPVCITSAPSDESDKVDADDLQYGDYDGLHGHYGTFFPVWTDRRNTGPEEIWTARVSIVEKRGFFWLDDGSLSQDVILAENTNPATFDHVLFFVVEGFTAAELHITRDDLGLDPGIVPRLEATPTSGMRFGPPTHLFAQDSSDLGLVRPQRFTWKYAVSFTDDNGLTAGPVRLRASVATVSAEAVIELPQPPNPHSIGWDLPLRRIPNTFEFRPTPPRFAQVARPDELVIDWGHLPAGAVARLYLPDVSADDIVEMAAKRYFAPRLARLVSADEIVERDFATHLATVDEHMLDCLVGGITYVPLPAGPEVSLLGQLTIDLPPGVETGQPFDVVVRQITYVDRIRDEPRKSAAGFESPRVLAPTGRDAPAAKRRTTVARGTDGLDMGDVGLDLLERRPRQETVPKEAHPLDIVEDRRDDGWWRVLATFRISIPVSTSSAIHEDEIAQRVRGLGPDLDRIRRSSLGSRDRPPMPGRGRPEPERKDATEGRTYDQFGFPIDPAGQTRLAGFGVVRTIALSTSMTQIIGPSQQRVALLFSPPTTAGQSYTVTTEPGASLGAGLNVTSTTGPLRLTEEVFGDAVKRPWFAAASSAFSIGVLETIVDDKS